MLLEPFNSLVSKYVVHRNCFIDLYWWCEGRFLEIYPHTPPPPHIVRARCSQSPPPPTCHLWAPPPCTPPPLRSPHAPSIKLKPHLNVAMYCQIQSLTCRLKVIRPASIGYVVFAMIIFRAVFVEENGVNWIKFLPFCFKFCSLFPRIFRFSL